MRYAIVKVELSRVELSRVLFASSEKFYLPVAGIKKKNKHKIEMGKRKTENEKCEQGL